MEPWRDAVGVAGRDRDCSTQKELPDAARAFPFDCGSYHPEAVARCLSWCIH